MNMRWLVLIVLVSWVATCGQKGPLELPDNRNAVTAATTSSAPAAVTSIESRG